MPYFLAVDAGGLKTEFLFAEDSRELGRTRTGTIKLSNTDEADAEGNVEAGLRELERSTCRTNGGKTPDE